MKIVVIGGTGLMGSKTVAILRHGGHDIFAASPKTGGWSADKQMQTPFSF